MPKLALKTYHLFLAFQTNCVPETPCHFVFQAIFEDNMGETLTLLIAE